MDLMMFLRSRLVLPRRRASGGTLPPCKIDDSMPVLLSPGRQVTDPDEAEALGLTAHRGAHNRLTGSKSYDGPGK
jgi:hypothetical protein